MKRFTALFESRDKDSELAIPENRMNRLRQSFRRRLSDSVEEVFDRACVENDLSSATALYGVLEDIYLRRQRAHGYERRIVDEAIANAKRKLDRCQDIANRATKVA